MTADRATAKDRKNTHPFQLRTTPCRNNYATSRTTPLIWETTVVLCGSILLDNMQSTSPAMAFTEKTVSKTPTRRFYDVSFKNLVSRWERNLNLEDYKRHDYRGTAFHTEILSPSNMRAFQRRSSNVFLKELFASTDDGNTSESDFIDTVMNAQPIHSNSGIPNPRQVNFNCTLHNEYDGDSKENSLTHAILSENGKDPTLFLDTSREDELRKRYEEAMKRRDMRRKRKETLQHIPERELEAHLDKFHLQSTNDTHEILDRGVRSGGSHSFNGNAMLKDRNFTLEHDSIPKDECTWIENETQKEQMHAKIWDDSQSMNDALFDKYSQKRYIWKDPYISWKDYNSADSEYNEEERHTKTNKPQKKPSYNWETYQSTSILLPSASSFSSRGIPCRPKVIIHFVGGTFFGSFPRKFYGKFLEDIAYKCEAVIVATPIPIVLPGKGLVNRLKKWILEEELERDNDVKRDEKDIGSGSNPLDHLHLAKVVQEQFHATYKNVILDEYCSDVDSKDEVENFVRSVPIVGMGHSLGARIQCISCSHPMISTRYLSMGKGKRLIRSGRDGMVYLGFANWSASSSVPGVEPLERVVKKRENSKTSFEGNKRKDAEHRDDIYGQRNDKSQQQRKLNEYEKMRQRYGLNSNRYSKYDVDDLDLVDVFSDVFSGIANGAEQIKSALTPKIDDLEFKPTPDELWEDLSSKDGGYSQNCRKTLIVQFDEDPIDQGSRLARVLLNAYRNENKSEHDVKFARLKGGHLTPISITESLRIFSEGALSPMSSIDFIREQLGDENRKTRERLQQELRESAETVESYIREIII